jgi:DoxX-like family
MKKVRIFYWIITILFGGFMMFSSISNVTSDPQAIEFFKSLGLPAYWLPFLGWAKILGCITILTPGLNKLKEWAYAGLAFDLIGALYAVIMSFGFQPTIAFLLLPLIFLFASYFLWKKAFHFSTNESN